MRGRDRNRQTGRTTRMLEEAVECKKTAPVRVIVHTSMMVNYCISIAPELKRNDVIVMSANLDRMLGAVRSQSQVFIDHAVWEHASDRDIRRLEAVLRLLDVRS
jgi:hypothetical protein